MWTSAYKPTEMGWYLVKVKGVKKPVRWNDAIKKFNDFDGIMIAFGEIDCWLDDSTLPQWHNCTDRLPLCTETGQWDGKRSDIVLIETDYKLITTARLYEVCNEWYRAATVVSDEKEIHDVVKWREF